ncbi:MAG: hypothetical protein Q8O03_08270 [Nanoarchaeota archaeon]|nr:hypothetical protein [Nanoarchaeota archaeon]
MKNIKKILLATSLATLLTVSCPSFSKAASPEDVNYLVEHAKRESTIKNSDEGEAIKTLRDEEKIGDLEKNLYFTIYHNPNGEVYKIFVTLDYMTHNGEDVDIKQFVIRDGYYGPLDGKPESAKQERVFEKEIIFTYEHEGKQVTAVMGQVEDIFVKYYNMGNNKEKELVEKVYDKAVDMFKLKTKKTLTIEEQSKYKILKQEIEDLVMSGEYFHKTRQQLEQEREQRLRS